MRGKRAKKRRKVFNIYNLLVLVSIVVIGGSAYILLKRNGIDLKEYPPISYVVEWVEGLDKEKEQDTNEPKNSNKPSDNTSNKNTTISNSTTNNNTNTSSTNEIDRPYVIDPGVSASEDITEEKAKEIALEQFGVLGEKDLKAEALECIKIKRDDILYYYISSISNTIEIKIEGGVITRINSELVNK